MADPVGSVVRKRRTASVVRQVMTTRNAPTQSEENDDRPLRIRYDYKSLYRVSRIRNSSDTRLSNSMFNPELSSRWKLSGVRRWRPGEQVGDPPTREPISSAYSDKRVLQPSDGRFVSLQKCYMCGENGHKSAECPHRQGRASWTRGGEHREPFRRQRNIKGTRQAFTERAFGEGAREPLESPILAPQPRQLAEREFGKRERERNRPSRWEDEEVEEEQWSEKRRSRQRFASRRNWKDDDYDDDVDIERIENKQQRKRERQRKKAQEAANELEEAAVPVSLPEHISVANLAGLLKVKGEDLLRKMADMGYTDVTFDYVLNAENSALIAMELGFEPTTQSQSSQEDLDIHAAPLPEDLSTVPARPPVVTIMGHVDHGKTTLLDYLRKSSIAAGEHGGITQHIGAFVVPLPNHDGKTITFLDTPGHAAFLTMRQRGANVTDIVILVVAADDSVMPQTIEAINHAKAAGVPIIVAINKCDKEDADSQRVKGDLARHGVEVEEYGGDVQAVEVSGKTGMGMKELEEAVVTLSEVLEKKAPVDGVAEGWVLEATTKKSGRVATVLVRRGTLKTGDVIVAGSAWAKVRSLRNEFGIPVKEAGPGTPVEVDGWRSEPGAGDEVLQAIDEEKASRVVEYRESIVERKKLADDMEAINAIRKLQQEKRHREEAAERAKKLGGWDIYGDEEGDLATSSASQGIIEVPFIVKADVAGSTEAVVNAISALGNNEIRAKVLRSGIGSVSEFDVEHAGVAEGHIISFNTRVDQAMIQAAAREGVTIVDQSIIYRVVEDVTTILSEKLPEKIVQSVTGEAEIAQTFSITVPGKKKILVAGCKVRNGIIKVGSKARVLRGTEVVYDGGLGSLKSGKKDVQEMRKDTECGMGFDDEWEGFHVGDRVQCYEETQEKRDLTAPS